MHLHYPADSSGRVLQQMKDSQFDFARAHPIEFYAVFAQEQQARQAAEEFAEGESLKAQVLSEQDGSWQLLVSKVMYATYGGIDDFSQHLEALITPLGGAFNGWGVTQEVSR